MSSTNDHPVWWLYQARRQATNTNAAGNPIIIDISLAAGQVAKLVKGFVQQSTTATHTLLAIHNDEDNVGPPIAYVAAAAAASEVRLPSIGTAANASANIMSSQGLMLGPGEKLTCQTGGASAAANDTLAVSVSLLLSTPTIPTWDTTRSTDTAQITLAASTISAANTLQAVVM